MIYKVRERLKDTISKFNAYILLLNEYLKWESVEGRPYNYIENVANSISNTTVKAELDPLIRSEAIDEGYKHVINDLQSLKYSYDYNEDNLLEITLDKDLITYIDTLLCELFPDLLYHRVGNQSLIFQSVDTSPHPDQGQDTEVIFKGEVKKLEIKYPSVDMSAYPKLVHVDILNGVVERIQDVIFNHVTNLKIEEQLC